MQTRAGAVVGALLLLISLLSACSRPDSASSAQGTATVHAVERIEIDYEYMGWESLQEHYVIAPQGGGFAIADNYERRRTPDGYVNVRAIRVLSTAKIQRLSDAVDASVQSRAQGLHAAAQAMSSKALAEAVGGSAEWQKRRCTRSQQKRYTQQLARGGAGHRLLENYYDSLPWTDDSPLIHVRVHRKGRPVVNLHSHVQQALMLPWQRDGIETWDPRISEAVAMLLPMESQAYERVSRRPLTVGLVGEAVQELKDLCGKTAAAQSSPPRTTSAASPTRSAPPSR